jgi:hypothetical protein
LSHSARPFFFFWDRISSTICLGLALTTCDPPDRCLLNYRIKPLVPSWIGLLFIYSSVILFGLLFLIFFCIFWKKIFLRTGVWTQGLALAIQAFYTHLSLNMKYSFDLKKIIVQVSVSISSLWYHNIVCKMLPLV